jgi:hypothetical protein
MKKKTIESGLLKGMKEALAHSKGSMMLKETEKEKSASRKNGSCCTPLKK